MLLLQDAGGELLDKTDLLRRYSGIAKLTGTETNPSVSLLLSEPGAVDAVKEILKQVCVFAAAPLCPEPTCSTSPRAQYPCLLLSPGVMAFFLPLVSQGALHSLDGFFTRVFMFSGTELPTLPFPGGCDY